MGSERRLQTILASAGVSSRRNSAKLIEAGKVKIDGHTVTRKGLRIDPTRHEITVNGRRVQPEKRKYYFLFNKPKGVISTAKDTHGRKSLTDFFKDINARVYPIGRLDKDTTGAILLTNDGAFAYKLAHPGFNVKKEYMVAASPPLARDDAQKLERGVLIDGKATAPCEISLISANKTKGTYRVIIHEGRKRQVKLMFGSVGSRVLELKRTKYAGLGLGRLKESEYRALTDKEIKSLKRASSS